MVHSCPTLISVFHMRETQRASRKIRNHSKSEYSFFELAVLEAGLASNFLQATGVAEVRPGRRKERKSKKEGVEYTGSKEKIVDRKGG